VIIIGGSIVRQSFLCHHQVDPIHAVVGGEALMAIFPFDGHVSRLAGCDFTAIGWIAPETNASADF
jgi:hypothetical protein